MKKTILAALAAGMAMVSAPASAVTTVDGTASGSTAGGPLAPVLFEELNPVTGQNVGVDPFDLPSLFFLRERTNVTVGSLSSLVNLSADTVVDSFYILFDPASTNPATTLFGEVVFGEEILAIITDTDDLEDTDSAFGLNTVNFPKAPASSAMNLCNIHTHTNAEHKGPGFSVFVDASDNGGYACNETADLTADELAPAAGAKTGVVPGQTNAVHWVHTTCDATPGEGLGACDPEGCTDPLLRVEAQTYNNAND